MKTLLIGFLVIWSAGATFGLIAANSAEGAATRIVAQREAAYCKAGLPEFCQ